MLWELMTIQGRKQTMRLKKKQKPKWEWYEIKSGKVLVERES